MLLVGNTKPAVTLCVHSFLVVERTRKIRMMNVHLEELREGGGSTQKYVNGASVVLVSFPHFNSHLDSLAQP